MVKCTNTAVNVCSRYCRNPLAILWLQSEYVTYWEGIPENIWMEGFLMKPYGAAERFGKYEWEDFGGWSRNHTKAASIRRWKRPLKKRARQVCRAVLRRFV